MHVAIFVKGTILCCFSIPRPLNYLISSNTDLCWLFWSRQSRQWQGHRYTRPISWQETGLVLRSVRGLYRAETNDRFVWQMQPIKALLLAAERLYGGSDPIRHSFCKVHAALLCSRVEITWINKDYGIYTQYTVCMLYTIWDSRCRKVLGPRS